MDTVTATEPTFGTLEYYLDMFRRFGWLDRVGHYDGLIIRQIQVVTNPEHLTRDAERIEQVRNILAAADQVRAEMAAR